MPSIGSHIHELRFRDRNGIYRIIYVLVKEKGIWLIHGFQKKSQKTPQTKYRAFKETIKGSEMKKTSGTALAKKLIISPAKGLEAVMKAELIAAISEVVRKGEVTHSEIATHSGIPRSAVTGILSGSEQRVTLDRLLRMLEASHLTAEVKIKTSSLRQNAHNKVDNMIEEF